MKPLQETTIYDIAKAVKLSAATVSRALTADPRVSEKTTRRVREMAEKMGYRSNIHARSLRQKHTNTIGFMVHELNSNFINSVLAGVEQVTTEAGYDLIIAHSRESAQREAANCRNLFHKRVDGIIASLALETNDLDHFRPFKTHDVPVIFFDRADHDDDNSAVTIDNYRSGYQATKHLIEQGCRRIVHVTASLTRNVYADRYRGYRQALSDFNLPFQNDWLMIGDLSEKAGIQAADRIAAADPRPDGAFITNDFVAAICMRSLKLHHCRIPEDIAVIGFNNDAVSKLVEPALTTIDYPGTDMGMIAARQLIDHLAGISDLRQVKTILVDSELIIRASSSRR